jgi:hypothetical protein
VESWVVSTGLIALYILLTIVLGFLANRALSLDRIFFSTGGKLGSSFSI